MSQKQSSRCQLIAGVSLWNSTEYSDTNLGPQTPKWLGGYATWWTSSQEMRILLLRLVCKAHPLCSRMKYFRSDAIALCVDLHRHVLRSLPRQEDSVGRVQLVLFANRQQSVQCSQHRSKLCEHNQQYVQLAMFRRSSSRATQRYENSSSKPISLWFRSTVTSLLTISTYVGVTWELPHIRQEVSVHISKQLTSVDFGDLTVEQISVVYDRMLKCCVEDSLRELPEIFNAYALR